MARSPNGEFEERTVEVADPGLSDEANQRLTEEAREVIGAERVRVPADRPHPSHGERPPRSTLLAAMSAHRLVLVEGLAGGVVGGLIIALITNDWWVLPISIAVLLVATGTVMMSALRMTSTRERPSPSTVAMLEEEGIREPEKQFSAIVEEFTEDEGARSENRRSTAVEDDPVKAAAEQQSATTPSGGPSHPVGPGDAPVRERRR